MMFMKVISVDELIEELERIQPQADEYNHDDSAYWGARDMYNGVMLIISNMKTYAHVEEREGE